MLQILSRERERPKIIDTFLYNGEPALQLRLEMLNNVVDEFVIVEAATTFSGVPKPFLFTDQHAALLEPYRHKVTIIIVKSFPEPSDADLRDLRSRSYINEQSAPSWFREQHQRDLIAPYVAERYKGQQYVVLVCDADEIPNPDVLHRMRSSVDLYHALDVPTAMVMRMFYYNFSWLRFQHWPMAFAVNDQGLQAIQGKLAITRLLQMQHIDAAGWHLCYFFNAEGVARKLRSYSHTEYSGEKFTDVAMIRRCLREGCDILNAGSDTEDETRPFDDISSLPIELQNFQKQIMFLQEYS
eukprot:TRINITY_DN1487_c1_g1_i2.p1 TRINITY_DN1487_c1_g1~~TRINITY_DN1487_c1_g1_i2.p1  ORF type:complete len:298 (+),score=29.00 TRINITY_DN1487_c1_g1_i2:370-1263(+)